MLKNILTAILFIFFCQNAFILRGQNTADVRRLAIPFSNASALNATVGGMNSPMLSEVDFDKNGRLDVFAFDRIGNVKMAFLNNPTSPKNPIFNEKFTNKIPDLNDWALMRDFDGDGAADIFTYNDGPVSGIRVFKGKYVNDSLTFDRMNFALAGNVLSYPLSSGFKVNLYVNSVDIPAIDDIDGDGDFDILAFEVGGGHVYWYKNLSVERGFQRDSLIFELGDDCWGKFFDNGFQGAVKLGTPTSCSTGFRDGGGGIGASLRHPGATIATFDADNDGIKDALLGSVSFSNMSFLKNTGTRTAAYIGVQDNNFPSNTEGVNIPNFPAAFFGDWDGDGLKDVAVTTVTTNLLESKKVNWFYKNIGTNALPRFQLIQKNYLVGDMVDLGSGANPTLIETNNDGLLDLVVGNGGAYLPGNNLEASLNLYRNIGTPTLPNFQLIDSNWLNFKAFSNGDVNNFAPTFGDLDGDGDDDMLVGEATGTLFFVENKSNQKGILQMGTPITNWKNMQIGSNGKPQIIDLDRDGLLDIVVGTLRGIIYFFKNKGTRTNPDFNPQANSTRLGNVDVSELADPAGYAAPFFVDFNGKYTLFCGSSNGRIWVFDSITNNIYGNYRLINADYGKLRDGWRTTPIIGNLISSDNKLEMILGNLRGGLTAYKISYNLDGTTPTQNIDNQPFATIFPNPTKDVLTIESTDVFQLKLMNYLGQIIKFEKNAPPQYKLDLSAFSTGFYLLELTKNNGEKQILKVIKSN